MNKVEYIERDGERFALVPAEAWEALKEFGETLIPAGDPSNPAAETGMPHFVLLAQLAGDSRLRAWRRYRGLQQKVLADKVGMGRSYLTMIESGEREGSVQIWQSLAAILDVPVSALMEETPVSDAHTASWRNDKAELCRLKQHVYAQAAERNISLALAWRLQLNLTQQQIAERMGVTRSWIGNLERKSNLQFSTSRRVARALAIPVEYLMP